MPGSPSAERSLHVVVPKQLKVRRFSTWDDYVSQFRADGVIENPDELLNEKSELLSDIFFSWVRQGQLSCAFAQKLARDPDAARWLSVVAQDVTPGALAENLKPVLDLAAEEQQAVQVILPRVSSEDTLAEIIYSLAEHDDWSVTERDLGTGIDSSQIAVGLIWHPPSRDYESWVLAFAPLASMPLTRRFKDAPFSVLVFRPTPPQFDLPGPEGVAHLAQMDDQVEDEEKRQQIWETTQMMKAGLLWDSPSAAARAKVTAVFSRALWR